MPKTTTVYQIKGSVPIENMTVEKLRAMKNNPNKFSQDSNEFK